MIDTALRLLEMGIDRIWPDKTEANKAKARLSEMALQGELQDIQNEFELAVTQAKINMEEAKSADIFVSGWRPFIGWVCGGAFAWNYVVRDFVLLLIDVAGGEVKNVPDLNLSEMMPVLIGMLGLGGYRSWEKAKGVARSKL